MNEKYLETELTRIFPECTASYADNLDDINSCFDIGVDLGTVLRLKFKHDHPAWCEVELFHMIFGGYVSTNSLAQAFYNHIWQGDLPWNDKDNDYDFQFLFTMLINWRNFK